ncbi:hypothetical protein NA57DRAFT_69973 [Rhizodiscina lignyota]|uniref:Uncharacterized protein n=1 Tax=Rhizodiscina lignyota TaxID=1504668 RepID=A0A9P4IQZ8_9PEZI|nr:hypothetical protein NA57DRAFT_69973 [Rhizodiscina lignyota]
MKSLVSAFYSICLLSGVVTALDAQLPRATDAFEHLASLAQGWTPMPTAAPAMRFDLVRRQDESSGTGSGSFLGWYVNDNTCGYVGGSLGGMKTCGTTEYCLAALDSSTRGVLGCCGSASNAPCTWYQACVDFANYFSSSACDHVCQQDINTQKCIEATAPYCFGYTMPGLSATYYSCDSVTTDVLQPFLTTFQGETDGRTWTGLYDTSSGGSSNTVNFQTPTSRSVGSTTTSSEGETSTSGSGNSSSDASGSSPTPSKKSSTPVGAIVGGVVGGLAVIGIAVGAIVWFCLRNKRKEKAGAAGGVSQQPGLPGPPPMDQTQYPQGYAAVPQQPYGQEYYQKQPIETIAGAPPQYLDKPQQGIPPPNMVPSPVYSPPPQSVSPMSPSSTAGAVELGGDQYHPVVDGHGQTVHEMGDGRGALH